jgi:collagenase-like PrtC family protease
LGRQAHVDAVLVRDPALLALRPEFPDIEFHFSTQTCMANSADVAAAGHWGASRVVLAREMALPEIAAASAVPGVRTEVFVQGALCFSVSGRCLLSSWVGGHSGNRGTCTSPCRVPWTVAGHESGTPLAMHDLAAIHRLDDLRHAGVAALKIEGRLKSPDWVRRAVGLYRRALEGQIGQPEDFDREVRQLGQYTGRALTCAYLDGQRDGLTGEAGRRASTPEGIDAGVPRLAGRQAVPAGQEGTASAKQWPTECPEALSDEPAPPDGPTFDLEILVAERGVVCRFACGEYRTEWSIPKTVVRRAHKAISIDQLLQWLPTQEIRGCRPGRLATSDPEFLLVPRAVNGLVDRISAAIRLAQRAPDEQVRTDLPDRVRSILAGEVPEGLNRRHLGEKPDRVRLEPAAVARFLKHVRPQAVIVEGLTAKTLSKTRAACGRTALVAALPPVFFEDDVPAVRALVRACVGARVAVEVNSWGGWWLARQEKARVEGGPGLAVLNSLAARVLLEAGIECVTLSVEADRRQLEEVSARCPAPCSLVVFGRPALAITRAELSAEDLGAQTLEDRRGLSIAPRREYGLWVLRPIEPFDLRGTRNERIRVSHLVVDLVGSVDPLADWYDLPEEDQGRRKSKFNTFRFNYDRALV